MTIATLRTTSRLPLAEVIPLAAPLMVRVDPANVCNFACAYCPTAHDDLLKQVGRPKGVLRFDLYEKIIRDLSEFAPLPKLYLYQNGEPLLNKRFPDMVMLAKAAGIPEVWTTTNGALLRPALNRRLVESGLDTIKISIQGLNAADYLHIARVDVDYEALRDNIADLFAHRGHLRVHVKIVDAGFSDEQRARFYADFSGIADSVHIDPLMGWSASSERDFTLGTQPTAGPDGRALSDRTVCPMPFYTMTVNVDGSVSMCCVDWAHATTVGNVKDERLRAIWQGANLRAFRMMHLDGRRHENKACGDCHYIRTLPDDLDASAAAIAGRL